MVDYADGSPVDTIADACKVDNKIDATNGRIGTARMAQNTCEFIVGP